MNPDLELRAAAALLQDHNWSIHRERGTYWVRILDAPDNTSPPIDSAVHPSLTLAVLDVVRKLKGANEA